MNLGVSNSNKYVIMIIKILFIIVSLIVGHKYYLDPLYNLIGKFYSSRIEVIGKENISKDNGYVIISNHNFMFESLIIRNIFYKNIYIVAKKTLLTKYLDTLGITLQYDKNIKNIKKSGDQIKETILQKCKYEKKNILVFPEGSWSDINKLLLFKKGLFYLCYKNNIPIIPIIFLIKKREKKTYWLCLDSKIKVKIFKMIYPKKFKNFNRYYNYIYNKTNNYVKKYIKNKNTKYSILL